MLPGSACDGGDTNPSHERSFISLKKIAESRSVDVLDKIRLNDKQHGPQARHGAHIGPREGGADKRTLLVEHLRRRSGIFGGGGKEPCLLVSLQLTFPISPARPLNGTGIAESRHTIQASTA